MIQGEQQAAGPRVLVLGEHTPNGLHVRECLRTLNVNPFPQQGAGELQHMHRYLLPDLVVLDGEDPGAAATCRTLKHGMTTFLIPVLAICNSEAQVRAMLAAGADDYVSRSAGATGLLAVTQVLLEQIETRRQAMATVARREELLRERIRASISRYLSPQLADRVVQEIHELDREILPHSTATRAAVMFADMRGFTSMAERLGPAPTLQVLNEYFSLLTTIAFRHHGTVFNMSGDSLMIGYGVPVERHDRAAQAVETASEMLVGFRDLADQWQDRLGVQVGLGIGINEGEVLTGDVGSAQFMNYTMIGDTVNVAARLSQRARAGEVLFSEAVERSLDENGFDVGALPLPPLTLRGRSAPLDIYCVPLSERVAVAL